MRVAVGHALVVAHHLVTHDRDEQDVVDLVAVLSSAAARSSSSPSPPNGCCTIMLSIMLVPIQCDVQADQGTEAPLAGRFT